MNIKWVPKGWGGEKIIINTDEYCGKILCFIRGLCGSLHYHKKKDETFYLQSGRLRVYYTDDIEKVVNFIKVSQKSSAKYRDFCDIKMLYPGDVFSVPRYRVHQIYAERDSELIEFSTHDEVEDSYRIVKGD